MCVISGMLVVLIGSCAVAAEVQQSGAQWRIENQALRVTVDATSGGITVLDKRNGYTWRQAAPLGSTAKLAIPRAAKPPTIDGEPGDWAGPVSFRLTPDMVAHAKKVDGPRDLSGEVRVAWDDRALYLAASVKDEKHVFATAADQQWWEKDSVEFWINARQFGVA